MCVYDYLIVFQYSKPDAPTSSEVSHFCTINSLHSHCSIFAELKSFTFYRNCKNKINVNTLVVLTHYL